MKYIISLLSIVSFCFAVMPPTYYKQIVDESKIKVKAKIIQVKVVYKTEFKIKKEITFKLLKSEGEVTPKDNFKGWCYSTNNKHLLSGEKYYYPEVGEIVYVTLSSEGGKVTSMKTLANAIQESYLHYKRYEVML